MKNLHYYDLLAVAGAGLLLGTLFIAVTVEIATFMIAAIFSILFYDLFMKFVIRGGRGIVQFRLAGTKTKVRWQAYLIFITAIFIFTLLSSYLAESIATILLATSWSKIGAGFIVAAVAYGELISSYYIR